MGEETAGRVGCGAPGEACGGAELRVSSGVAGNGESSDGRKGGRAAVHKSELLASGVLVPKQERRSLSKQDRPCLIYSICALIYLLCSFYAVIYSIFDLCSDVASFGFVLRL